jgi:hypothetical protein
MTFRWTRNRTTDYSDLVPGEAGNHHRAVRFDLTGSYLGIAEMGGENEDGTGDRILLSRAQIRAMLRFLDVRP